MSSPITAKKKGALDEALIAAHRKLSHSRRIELLAGRVADIVRAQEAGGQTVRCLDVGCGDMQLAERVAELAPASAWSCIDIHVLPGELRDEERWRKYRTFDGRNIPFPDKSFDVVLFCDVLHHVREGAQALLTEAARAGRAVVIKDHFEYSLFSRMMLWGMDFLGNWGYGVALPDRYFTQAGFAEMAANAGLRVKHLEAGIDLYAHLPVVRALLRPKWQFIAVLEPAGR
jgi:SAM-dependent methyltransferase